MGKNPAILSSILLAAALGAAGCAGDSRGPCKVSSDCAAGRCRGGLCVAFNTPLGDAATIDAQSGAGTQDGGPVGDGGDSGGMQP